MPGFRINDKPLVPKALQFSSHKIILILKMVLELRWRDEYSERPLCLKKLSPQPRRFRYFLPTYYLEDPEIIYLAPSVTLIAAHRNWRCQRKSPATIAKLLINISSFSSVLGDQPFSLHHICRIDPAYP